MTIENYNDKFLTAAKVINLLDDLAPHYKLPDDTLTYEASYETQETYQLTVISEKLETRFTIRKLQVLEDTLENRNKVLTEVKSRLWDRSFREYVHTGDEYTKLLKNNKINGDTDEHTASDRIRNFLDLVHDWFDGFKKVEKIDFLSGPSLRLTWNNISTKNRDIVTTFKTEDIINDTNGKLLMRQIVKLIADGYSPFVRITVADLVSGSVTSQKVNTEALLGTITSANLQASTITPDVRNLLLDVKSADGSTELKVDSDGTINAGEIKTTELHEETIKAGSINPGTLTLSEEAAKKFLNPIPNSFNALHVEPANPETHHVEFINGHPTVVPNKVEPKAITAPELEEYVDLELGDVWDEINSLDHVYENHRAQLKDLTETIRKTDSAYFAISGQLNKALRVVDELKAQVDAMSAPDTDEAPQEQEASPNPINIVVNTLKELDHEAVAKMAADTLKSYFKGRL